MKGLRIKFTIVGDKSVGKTTIARKFGKKTQERNIGIETYKVNYKKNEEFFIFEIVDMPSEGFPLSEFEKSNFVVIVFDITNRKSFFTVNNFINICNDSENKNINLILVGNKKDLELSREVTTEEAKKLAKKNGMQFYEISALNEIEVEKIFKDGFNDFYESIEDMFDFNDNNITKVGDSININNIFYDNDLKRGCCWW